MIDKQNYFTYIDNTSDDNDKIMENLHKQAIIDGVDVSGCECYSEHREGYCGWHTPCEGDTCPYKLKWALQQLKLKEQECEEKQKTAQDAISKLCAEKSTLCNELDQLKEQNEQLTNKLKSIIEWRHKYCINCEDLLKPYKSCEGCYMAELKRIVEE